MNNHKGNSFTLDDVSSGVWWSLHLWALNSESIADRYNLCGYVHFLSRDFVCDSCKHHITDFCREYPPERYAKTKESMFRWTYDLHVRGTENANKKRIEKGEQPHNIISYEEALNIYTEKVVSTCKDCTYNPNNSVNPSNPSNPNNLSNLSNPSNLAEEMAIIRTSPIFQRLRLGDNGEIRTKPLIKPTKSLISRRNTGRYVVSAYDE